jgi:hypothetical protein
MERFNLAAKALHVGLSSEHDELEISSKICKFLDAALAELPANVVTRLEQVRCKALTVHRLGPFSGPNRYRSDL